MRQNLVAVDIDEADLDASFQNQKGDAGGFTLGQNLARGSHRAKLHLRGQTDHRAIINAAQKVGVQLSDPMGQIFSLSGILMVGNNILHKKPR